MKLQLNVKTILSIFLVSLTIAVTIFIINYAPQNIDSLKSHALFLLNFLQNHPISGTLIFIFFYFLINALPLPLISLPTILAGYLFGTIKGLIIVSFASALGASCLFLISRYLFKDKIKKPFASLSITL